MKKTIASILIAQMLILQPLAALAQDVHPDFNSGVLIPDSAFNDIKTFGGPEGIQRFLESKNSVLARTTPDFLVMLREPNDVNVKQILGDPEPNKGQLRTAAELIWDAAQVSGLNPQVILATLNKEQGLVTSNIAPDRLQKALNHAMGFDCPDNSGCGNLFPGFYFQLFGNVDTEGNKYLGATKSLMKSFMTPGGRGPTVSGVPAKVGDSITLQNDLGAYAGVLAEQVVTIGNSATAALYRYTPHVFNGNYNFWKFFTSWFRFVNGTLIRSTDDNQIYIIGDGQRHPVPTFVSAARNLDLSKAISASPTELTNFPLGGVYGPADNTVVMVNDSLFVFENNIRHPVSSFVLGQRKLSPASLTLSDSEAALFPPGPQLTPSDGTVLRAQSGVDVYLVEKGVLKLFSAFTLKQRNAAPLIQLAPDEEVAIYPKLGYVAPLPGTLIKSRSTNDIYVMSEGQRLPLTNDLFKNLGYSMKNVVTLASDAELASIPLGAPAAPRNGTYFEVSETHDFFLFKDGAKHQIFPFVAKQRGMTPDYSFAESLATNWPDGIAIPPRDKSLVKSDASATVYLVTNGQLHPLTMALVKNLQLNLKNVITVPDAQVTALPKGGYATPAEESYFTVAKTKEFYRYKNGVKQRIYPFTASQRGMTPDFTFSAIEVADWPTGSPIPPRNGTLLQGKGRTTIYVVKDGKLRSVSTAAFKRLGYSKKNVKVITAEEIDALPKGAAISK